jgi:DNA replication protein DnaC
MQFQPQFDHVQREANLLNQSAFLLGVPGSGKSFFCQGIDRLSDAEYRMMIF